MMKRQLLGSGGHGRQRLPTLATNLELMDGTELAAPYLRHIGLAAPYLSAAVSDLLPGLLLPSIGSPKPPAARRAPTRVNLFKASRTMAVEEKCGGCPIFNGTIIVTHFGYVPPQTFLCYTVGQGDCEQLVPYAVVQYQEDPARQFTYAANAASSISLEITSFAANNPLNGQATSAHVMDIDDICTYSSGTFELRSTTPKDATSATSLAGGLVGIMGPESFTTTLLHPYHCGTKTYPGWSTSFEAKPNPDQNISIKLSELTSHRWFVNTTFQITVTLTLQNKDGKFDSGGTLTVLLATVKGTCPPTPEACQTGLGKWAATDHNYNVVATSTIRTCPAATITTTSGQKLAKPDHQDYVAWRKKQLESKKSIKCPSDKQTTCVVEEEPTCTDESGPKQICCRDKKTTGSALEKPEAAPFNQVSATGMYTTCELENATEIYCDWTPCKDVTALCYRVEIRTMCHDPTQQFGPAIVTRLEGLTKDIILQMNIRSAVAGIQTGEARSVAPPTGPSMLGLGDEDAVLVQAQFDDPSTPVARVMTAATYRNAAQALPDMHREHAIGLMEAAPIGDTIRSIGSTIQRIGNSLGGPFSSIGDIIGTVGNVAGGIGDAIGSIFSAPKRLRLAAPLSPALLYAKPEPAYNAFFRDQGKMTFEPAQTVAPTPGSVSPTPTSVMKAVSEFRSWSINVSHIWTQTPRPTSDTMQAFPWVTQSGGGGVSHVFVTTEPMSIPTRTYIRYVHYSTDMFDYYIDEHLTSQNDAMYVKEAVAALLALKRRSCFLTTDAEEFIYGDSFAAAILAAGFCPSPQTAVTGSISPKPTGAIDINPVGMTAQKTKAAMDAGYILVAPQEPSTAVLRANSEGTEAVNINDITQQLLTQTPALITVTNLSDLILANTFASASTRTPIGETETAEKAAQVEKSRAKAREIDTIRQEWALTGDPDIDQYKVAKSFPVNIEGFGTQQAPLLDLAWWNNPIRKRDLIGSPTDGGMGYSMTKLENKINAGDIPKLTGLAIGLLSRELSRSKKGEGRGRPKKRQPQGRLPPYKRPPSTQIASLIDRLRQSGGAQEAQQPGSSKRQRTTEEPQMDTM